MNVIRHHCRIPFLSRSFISRSLTYICGLSHRAVIEVNGKDSSQLLQGLITNNINSLAEENPTIYALLLNDKGRIVHDLLVYRGADPDRQFFLECDASEDQSLIDLLKLYKLRKKVALKKRADMEVCSVFHPDITNDNTSIIDILKPNDNERCFKDPRLPQLGHRVLTESSQSLLQGGSEHYEVVPLDIYNRHRYNLGIGEGKSEVEGGIPHEHNFDRLNGVAFDKGCYIGQELVARVHFTGQVRKRVMPLRFDKHAETGESIRNSKGKRVGRVISCSNTLGLNEDESDRTTYVGIGVVNVQQATSVENSDLSTTQLQLDKDDGIKVVVKAPDWWPKT